ncbi:MAG TPA: cytochrome P450 [Lysobacter sp.]|nr:cytochrome P450 [Lysobacter sp.]
MGVTLNTGLPRAPEFDSTLALRREGYAFGIHRFERLGCDAFETRIGLGRVVFARGAEAAAMFYHPGRFTRRGAVPPTTLVLLQDFGSMQQLDDEDHRHRKALFLRLLDVQATTRLALLFREEWDRQAADWERRDAIVLQAEVELILCRAVCRWAGVPLDDAEAAQRAGEFGAMLDGAGATGARLVHGMRARARVERWIRDHVRALRAGDPCVDSPAAAIARHRDRHGALLDELTAAVELINLLRPTVAVARWVTFAALALHDHRHLLPRLRAREPRLLQNMAQEVRRFYPLFPAIGGRVRVPFEWRGRRFRRGDRVMLDLHGTDHDPRLWAHPERFDPDRFRDWRGGLFDLIPQGAGDVARGHRCPGENPAIALLMIAIDGLATRLRYEVPPQDLRYRVDRVPSRPASGFVMRDVRRVGAAVHELAARREPAHAARERHGS